MKLPGFTAESSLYRMSRHYAASIRDAANIKQGIATASDGGIMPIPPWFSCILCQELGIDCPSIDVQTTRNQLGGWVTVNGSNFTPNSNVEIDVTDLQGRSSPLSEGRVTARGDGTFTYTFDAWCWPYQFSSATVNAKDSDPCFPVATGETYAFTCGY